LKLLLQAVSVSNRSDGFMIDVQNQLFTRLSNSMIQLARPLSRWRGSFCCVGCPWAFHIGEFLFFLKQFFLSGEDPITQDISSELSSETQGI
jgi:hypothetical protein